MKVILVVCFLFLQIGAHPKTVVWLTGLPFFTGIGSPYEKPKKADVVCHTDQEVVETSGDRIMRFMSA